MFFGPDILLQCCPAPCDTLRWWLASSSGARYFYSGRKYQTLTVPRQLSRDTKLRASIWWLNKSEILGKQMCTLAQIYLQKKTKSNWIIILIIDTRRSAGRVVGEKTVRADSFEETTVQTGSGWISLKRRRLG